jgi:hypothetical protein
MAVRRANMSNGIVCIQTTTNITLDDPNLYLNRELS